MRKAFICIRQKYFPGMQERDVLGLPASLRSAGIAPEPVIVEGEGFYWGTNPTGAPMSTDYALACGMGKLPQWARSRCLRAQDNGRVTLRATLQHMLEERM